VICDYHNVISLWVAKKPYSSVSAITSERLRFDGGRERRAAAQ